MLPAPPGRNSRRVRLRSLLHGVADLPANAVDSVVTQAAITQEVGDQNEEDREEEEKEEGEEEEGKRRRRRCRDSR